MQFSNIDMFIYASTFSIFVGIRCASLSFPNSADSFCCSGRPGGESEVGLQYFSSSACSCMYSVFYIWPLFSVTLLKGCHG